MIMKINRYKEFINESNYIGKLEGENLDILYNQTDLKLREVRDDFRDIIIGELSHEPSYSTLCKKKSDPDLKFEECQSKIESLGWNIKSIKNLFSDEFNRRVGSNFEDFVTSGGLDNQNGVIDLYLYKLAEKLEIDPDVVELGGGGWSEYVSDYDESLIRYQYGYHHTKYGELMLKQAKLSKDKFIEMSLNRLREVLINQLENDDLKKVFRSNFGPEKVDILSNYLFVDDDRLIVYTDDITNIINEYGIRENDPYTRDMKKDEFESRLLKLIDEFGLIVTNTGTELIFSDKISY